MAELVIVYGPSGAGKTRSLKLMDKKKTMYINVTGKRPPFQEKFAYQTNTKNVETIKKALASMKKVGCNAAVIDDSTYIMTQAFMDGHSQPKQGASQYDLYNHIADIFYEMLVYIRDEIPEDDIVYVVMHEEVSDAGSSKLRTIGKLLDQKVCIEGLATIVLHCKHENGDYHFITNTDGYDIAKSPDGMFEKVIPNDLNMVDETIRKFYGIEDIKQEVKQ